MGEDENKGSGDDMCMTICGGCGGILLIAGLALIILGAVKMVESSNMEEWEQDDGCILQELSNFRYHEWKQKTNTIDSKALDMKLSFSNGGSGTLRTRFDDSQIVDSQNNMVKVNGQDAAWALPSEPCKEVPEMCGTWPDAEAVPDVAAGCPGDCGSMNKPWAQGDIVEMVHIGKNMASGGGNLRFQLGVKTDDSWCWHPVGCAQAGCLVDVYNVKEGAEGASVAALIAGVVLFVVSIGPVGYALRKRQQLKNAVKNVSAEES
eukprot:gnl/MRDRNA2_/MRDRNA2_96830_c0_seq1.p1 gnl/MRDRNA2_/MRDRNA2_96830_c0~~gnl/MRDRNA2_/MRDRNA2_96830_c0_seq1.p1  ORF type:complete len:263 (+),score=53.77 gnl/MRDRNA2_/MRDRNA2_96830_c0_seq1:106-894(+)